ncbi:homeobox protein notochord [Galendromus occidentalis]|uniref:Homeobox protein notochord n=1 Tax=Galendromus occidentalis TaxID=34638 RepID=A0AAJ6W0J1_9ACAR|nr:homeobox protein notochord [Galendromus occidentalis]
MLYSNLISAASVFQLNLPNVEPLTPRSPYGTDRVFHFSPSSPSCSSGGIPSPRVRSPCPARKTSFTIEAILGLSPHYNEKPVNRQTLPTPTICKDSITPPPQGNPLKRKASDIGGTKAKRNRTIFTPDQLDKLEAVFVRQPYMVGPDREALAHSLGLTQSQVKVWFQNRRIKLRKTERENNHRVLGMRKNSDSEDLAEMSDERGSDCREKEFDYSDA